MKMRVHLTALPKSKASFRRECTNQTAQTVYLRWINNRIRTIEASSFQVAQTNKIPQCAEHRPTLETIERQSNSEAEAGISPLSLESSKIIKIGCDQARETTSRYATTSYLNWCTKKCGYHQMRSLKRVNPASYLIGMTRFCARLS